MLLLIWSLRLVVSINIGQKLRRHKLGTRTPGKTRRISFLVRRHRVTLLRHLITLILKRWHSVDLDGLIASLLTPLLRVDQDSLLRRTLIIVKLLLKLSCVFKLVILLNDLQRVSHLGVPCRDRCLLNEIQRFFRIILIGKAQFVFCYCFCLICFYSLRFIFTFGLRVKRICGETYEPFWSFHFGSYLGLSLK